MKMLRNMRLASRLTLISGALLALSVIVAGVGFGALRATGTQATLLAHEDLALATAANAMYVAQLEQAVALRDFVLQDDKAARSLAGEAIQRSAESYANAASTLLTLAERAADTSLVDSVAALKKGQENVLAKMNEIVGLVDAGRPDRARAAVQRELAPSQRAVMEDLLFLTGTTGIRAQKRAAAAENATADAQKYIAIALAASLAIGILGTFWLIRAITRPLGSAVVVTERVAEGDLTGEIHAESSDETGRLLAALSRMQDSLHELASRIRDGARVVSNAAEEIARGNGELSRRTEDQASSLEQVAASVEQITSSVKQNADNAKAASHLADKAAEEAQHGGEVVGRVVETMNAIHSASQRMADIVAIIDGIAFQTNILALNAAVEAARAGEQGRGFAVVASEVRALAQRSAAAAKDVKTLIAEGVEKSSAGSALAGQTGGAMTKIIGTAKEVSRYVADISRASQEQRAGVEQISGALAQMEDATQRNAGLVEETNAATQALLDQARDLVHLLERFKLDATRAATPVVLPATEVSALIPSPA